MNSLSHQLNYLSEIFSKFSFGSWLIFIVGFLFVVLLNRTIILPTFNFFYKRIGKGRYGRIFSIIYPINRSIFWLLIGISLNVVILLPFNEGEVFVLERLQKLFFILAVLSYGISFIQNLKEIMVLFNNEDMEGGVFEQVNVLIRFVLKLVFWSFTVLSILHYVFGVNITTWLAGLGILGLGVSLALQDTFRNLFGSLIIIADKPFREGDRIVFGGFDGTVEKLGIRTTRMRTLDGHLVSLPNSKLAEDVIDNVSERPSFKRIINIGITYDTPTAKIESAIDILKDILAEREENSPLYTDPNFLPKIFFSGFGDFSLNLLVIYWYSPANDYWAYMEHCQTINLKIFDRFEKAGINFAFPTQTLHLAENLKGDNISKNHSRS